MSERQRMYDKLPKYKLTKPDVVFKSRIILNHFNEVLRYLLDDSIVHASLPVGPNTNWDHIALNTIRNVTDWTGHNSPYHHLLRHQKGIVVTLGVDNHLRFQLALNDLNMAFRNESPHGKWIYLNAINMNIFSQKMEELNNLAGAIAKNRSDLASYANSATSQMAYNSDQTSSEATATVAALNSATAQEQADTHYRDDLNVSTVYTARQVQGKSNWTTKDFKPVFPLYLVKGDSYVITAFTRNNTMYIAGNRNLNGKYTDIEDLADNETNKTVDYKYYSGNPKLSTHKKFVLNTLYSKLNTQTALLSNNDLPHNIRYVDSKKNYIVIRFTAKKSHEVYMIAANDTPFEDVVVTQTSGSAYSVKQAITDLSDRLHDNSMVARNINGNIASVAASADSDYRANNSYASDNAQHIYDLKTELYKLSTPELRKALENAHDLANDLNTEINKFNGVDNLVNSDVEVAFNQVNDRLLKRYHENHDRIEAYSRDFTTMAFNQVNSRLLKRYHKLYSICLDLTDKIYHQNKSYTNQAKSASDKLTNDNYQALRKALDTYSHKLYQVCMDMAYQNHEYTKIAFNQANERIIARYQMLNRQLVKRCHHLSKVSHQLAKQCKQQDNNYSDIGFNQAMEEIHKLSQRVTALENRKG